MSAMARIDLTLAAAAEKDIAFAASLTGHTLASFIRTAALEMARVRQAFKHQAP